MFNRRIKKLDTINIHIHFDMKRKKNIIENTILDLNFINSEQNFIIDFFFLNYSNKYTRSFRSQLVIDYL